MRLIALFALTVAACALRRAPAPTSAETTLITNGRLVDGSGSRARPGGIRIAGDRIAEVGALRARPGERVIDAGGLVLAPGLIDTHSYHDRGLFDMRDAVAAVSQGITTIVVGQDGGSRSPLAEFFARLEREPPALNVASYSEHGSIREQVMSDDFRRMAKAHEIERMRAMVHADMEAGALGLCPGLEYDPGIYSDPQKVVELAKIASAFGGRYLSHMRSEDRQLVRDTFVGGGVVMKFRRAGGRVTGAHLHSGRVRNIVFSRVRER